MADKKVTPPLAAYPQQPPQGPFLPQPPHQPQQYGVGGGGGYGVSFGAGVGGMGVGGAGVGGVVGGGMYAPPYEQLQHHQPIPQHLPMYSPAAAMYAAAAGYPGYIGYPVQYYPYYQTVQPSIQPLRPTIMIPNGLEGGGRLEGLGLLPPAAPPAPHLALQPHQVLWR